MVDNDATEDLMLLLLLLVVLEVVVVVDGNGAEPPPEDCDDWFDFVEFWRDRDEAGADHGVEDDVVDVTAATCSSLSTEMSSRKLLLFFVIVRVGVNNVHVDPSLEYGSVMVAAYQKIYEERRGR